MELRQHLENAFITHPVEQASITYQLLSSMVVPRPIAFVTTLGTNGVVNAAPFSFFNAVSTCPPLISISIEGKSGEKKDTARNILTTQEFVINVVSLEMAQTVTHASKEYPPDVSEVEITKLTLIPSQKVKPPRIANTLIQMECTLYKSLEIGPHGGNLFLGEIINIHLHKEILDKQGNIEICKLNPLGRLTGKAYAQIISYFETQ